VALVSDAGTPLISDPGYKLVREAGPPAHAIVTLPGPCAAIAALTLAGLPTDRFLFLGFLPPKEKARADAIAEVAAIRATLVLYESGPRLAAPFRRLPPGSASARPRSRGSSPSFTRNASPAPLASLPPLCRRPAKGRDRDRRRTAGRARSPSDRRPRRGARARACCRGKPEPGRRAVAQQLGVKRKLAYERALELGR
jgi:16S rRNA (cytidine1402-2'-O)-methyltransferase